LYRVRDRGLISVVYMGFQHYWLRRLFFPMYVFYSFVENLIAVAM
jgi:hypothetical protein